MWDSYKKRNANFHWNFRNSIEVIGSTMGFSLRCILIIFTKSLSEIRSATMTIYVVSHSSAIADSSGLPSNIKMTFQVVQQVKQIPGINCTFQWYKLRFTSVGLCKKSRPVYRYNFIRTKWFKGTHISGQAQSHRIIDWLLEASLLFI